MTDRYTFRCGVCQDVFDMIQFEPAEGCCRDCARLSSAGRSARHARMHDRAHACFHCRVGELNPDRDLWEARLIEARHRARPSLWCRWRHAKTWEWRASGGITEWSRYEVLCMHCNTWWETTVHVGESRST